MDLEKKETDRSNIFIDQNIAQFKNYLILIFR